MKNSIYKGYIASRAVRDTIVPQRLQNLVIRTYAEKNKKKFSLSATEYIMDECFMMLRALIKDASQYEAIAIYSLYMLPKSKDLRLKFYQECLALDVEMHFAFEELVIKNESDIQLIEDILLAKDLTSLVINPTQVLG